MKRSRMETLGTLVTELEVIAAASLLNTTIYIYIYIYIYGTVHAKIAYSVYIYKVIKMIHFEIATSPEP